MALPDMPRYDFDLVDYTAVEDKGGQILADDMVASDVADEMALRVHEARPEFRGKGYSILVTNTVGDEIHRAPLEGCWANAGQPDYRVDAEALFGR